MTIIIFANYNYYRSISLSCSLPHEIITMEVVPPDLVILCKKLWRAKGPEPLIFYIFIDIFK